MLSAKLLVRGGKHDGRGIQLPKGRFLIGREQDCNLRPASDLVSRHHCVFHVDDFTVRLRDLGSTNGTLVDGERLSGERTLKNGTAIAVGKLNFELELRDVAEAPRPEAAPDMFPGSLPAQQADGAETSYELPIPTERQSHEDTRVAPAGPASPAPLPGGQTAGQPYPNYGYPQGYPAQYPGYPPQPYPYPQQYPGYPQQGYPYPPQGGPPPAPEGGGGNTVEAPPVRLPPPPPAA